MKRLKNPAIELQSLHSIVKSYPHFFGAVCLVLTILSGCSSTAPEQTQEDEISTDTRLPMHGIPFDPRYLSDEWINVILSDSFNGELDLEREFELYDPEEIVQLMFVASGLEGPQYYQLLDASPNEGSFTLSEVANTEASAILKHRNSAAIEFYRIFDSEVIKDGEKEVVVGAEVTGTYHDNDGMRPYHMIVYDVLVKDQDGFAVDEDITRTFNSRLGIDVDEYRNLSLPELLSRKYFSISEDEPVNETKTQLQELLDDMNISSYAEAETDNEFATVFWRDDHYVVDLHWLATGYYFLADEYSGYNMSGSPHSSFPMLYIVDREVDEWKITEAVVKPDSIVFSFQNLEKGSNEELTGSFVYDEEQRWLFRFDGYTYMKIKDSEEFEVVGYESDQ